MSAADVRIERELREDPIVEVGEGVYEAEVYGSGWVVRLTPPPNYPFSPPKVKVRRERSTTGKWTVIPGIACTPAMTMMQYAMAVVAELPKRADDLERFSEAVFESAIGEMEESTRMFREADRIEKHAERLRGGDNVKASAAKPAPAADAE